MAIEAMDPSTTEQALLGALILAPKPTWESCSGRLLEPGGLFSHPAHRAIGEALIDLCQAGQWDRAGDPVILAAHLSDAGKMPAPVPPELPFALSRGLGTAVNAAHYADRLAELRERRAQPAGPSVPVNETRNSFEVAGLHFVRASAVRDVALEWHMPGFIARGTLTDLSADPGVGKSSILASLAAATTRGRVLPRGEVQAKPAVAILLATEDGLGMTLKQRLRAEGADLEKVILFDTTIGQRLPSFPNDGEAFEALIRRTGAAFVGLDPALHFFDGELDSHRQQDVQQFTASLSLIAQRTGVSIVTARHLNKAKGLDAVYRGAGSIAFIAQARMALLAAKHQEQRILAVAKGNIGRDRYSITFDIVEKDGSSVVAWGEPSVVTADELVTQDPKRQRGPAPEKTEAARDFLTDLLAGGPVPKQDVLEKGKAAGLSRSLLYAVARQMGLADATVDLKVAWRLP